MKLLWVKYGKILPVDTGGKLRSFNLLRELAKRLDLTFFNYYDGTRDTGYETALGKEFPGAVIVQAPDLPVTRPSLVRAFARSVFSAAPFTVSRFTSPTARRQAAALLRSRAFDVALCDFLTPTLTFPASFTAEQGLPSVLFEHNVESDLWRRRFLNEGRPALRAIYWWESRRMLRWEARMLAAYSHVLAVSERDREHFLGLARGTRIDVVPTGVDLRLFHPVASEQPSPGLVVFVGSMDWEPNIDGVEWFVESVWPAVRGRVPGARFQIVGRSPDPRVLRLAGPDVEVTGSVPSVVEHLRRAAVVVVPLRVGGGTRLKIYEAMATGAPVVSTTIGAEGLDVRDGDNILLRDEAGPFAEALAGLLGNHELRLRMGEAARRLAVRYDWSCVADRLEATLRQVRDSAEKRRTPGENR